MKRCPHSSVRCLNQYELIRKYRCEDCSLVMICLCEKEFACGYLSHQIDFGVALETQKRIKVTGGFSSSLCNSCRGSPEDPSPKSKSFGRTSKILRYYWREIAHQTILEFAAWAKNEGFSDWTDVPTTHRDRYDLIERKVIEEVKVQHARNPKYLYADASSNATIQAYRVEVVDLNAVYSVNGTKGRQIVEGSDVISPEEFVARHFKANGYKSLFIESAPFHVLFGVFTWLLIEGHDDPEQRFVTFGERDAYEAGRSDSHVQMVLPSDFGTAGYFRRRSKAIEEHLKLLPGDPGDRSELIWLFDYWLEASSNLRQYLWAHRPDHIEKAFQILLVLPPADMKKIIVYLLKDYWKRYLGWPDLLIYDETEYFFVEVKSSKDKLSDDQKTWVAGNAKELLLPFKIVKVHRRTTA